jgi:methionyl-tRNA synthetase
MLDLLSVPAEARGFDRLGEGGRLQPGAGLPPPSAVFPRHVEPEGAAQEHG